MPNCPRCGNPVSGSVCQRCGQSLLGTAPQQMQPYQYQQIPPPQYVPPGDKSMVPIIVAIIIVVTIALCAFFFMFFITSPTGPTTTTTTPIISMNWVEDPEIAGNYTGNIVSISGTGPINTEDVLITVTHGSNSGSQTLDGLSGTGYLAVEDFTLDFFDNPPIGELGAEDIFTITGGNSGDVIRLVYRPTSGQMCSITLH